MHECTPGRCYTTPRGRARADTAGVAFVLAAEANAADHVGRADRMGAHAVTHAAACVLRGSARADVAVCGGGVRVRVRVRVRVCVRASGGGERMQLTRTLDR